MTYDSSRVPPWLSNLDAGQQNQLTAYVTGFEAEGMAPPQALQLGAEIFRLQYQKAAHPARADKSAYARAFAASHPGAQVPNVLIDRQPNAQGQYFAHFWNGKGWTSVPYNPAGQSAAMQAYDQAMQRLEYLGAYGGGAPAAPAGLPSPDRLLTQGIESGVYGGSSQP